ncbi:MAG TPA: Gfo/Idh/MocA family oxidoreductase [Candidatus Elarobacter sp.]|nr:Gfo/Idh/MocA family oxidoreductase [Candidatus Elarobacter sp.]
MSETLRLGVIGLGRAAAQTLPSIVAHPHVRVVAAADPSAEARSRFVADFGAPAFAGIEELCAHAAVDALYVATPHQRHVTDVLIAAANGKHVLVEKPMALTIEDCRAMTSAAARAGVALVAGPTHGMDPAVVRIAQIASSGELGRVRMITNIVYGDFLYRPRRPEELDTALGGGIMYNQVPHQIEIAREIDGGPVRTIRATTGVWDARRTTEGASAAFVEFESGTVAQLTYNGYDRFDSDELCGWIGEMGAEKPRDRHGAARRALKVVAGPDAEAHLKAASGFAQAGVMRAPGAVHQPHFGFLLVSCERGDLRPSADGVLIYGDDGVREIPLEQARAFPNRLNAIDELYDAVARGVAPRHDGAWGTETLATVLAMMTSARERREVAVGTMVDS